LSLFFRNPLLYELLEQTILPLIIESKRETRQIRVWSAGCAHGEEPYSVAILLMKILKEQIKDWELFIFATDIDKKRISRAGREVYPRDKLVDTKLGIIDEYFTETGEGFMLEPSVRNMVNFSLDDLSSPNLLSPAESIFGGFDLVMCRNVLIYFNEAGKFNAIKKCLNSIVPGGYLVLGESEWLSDESLSAVREVDRKSRIFKKGLLYESVKQSYC